jgi:hypothetical protein
MQGGRRGNEQRYRQHDGTLLARGKTRELNPVRAIPQVIGTDKGSADYTDCAINGDTDYA